MERWAGKVAVVTGATGGIGGGIVEALSEAKLRVVGLDLNESQSVTVSSGDRENVKFRKCDVTNLEELKATFQWIEQTYGGVDVMVNCAGCAAFGQITSVGPKPVSDEEIARVMDLNTKSLVFCTRLAVDSMTRREFHGHVVNICSVAGHYIPISDEFNVYASSKYAVKAFSQTLAHEFACFGSKIRITNVSPGLVKTALSARHIDKNAPYLLPRDVANAIVYALSTPPHVNISEMTITPTAEIKK